MNYQLLAGDADIITRALCPLAFDQLRGRQNRLECEAQNISNTLLFASQPPPLVGAQGQIWLVVVQPAPVFQPGGNWKEQHAQSELELSLMLPFWL